MESADLALDKAELEKRHSDQQSVSSIAVASKVLDLVSHAQRPSRAGPCVKQSKG